MKHTIANSLLLLFLANWILVLVVRQNQMYYVEYEKPTGMYERVDTTIGVPYVLDPLLINPSVYCSSLWGYIIDSVTMVNDSIYLLWKTEYKDTTIYRPITKTKYKKRFDE